METLVPKDASMGNNKELMIKETSDTCLDILKKGMYVGQDCPTILKEVILKNVRQAKKHCVNDLNKLINEVCSNVVTMQALCAYIACYYNRSGIHVCMEEVINNYHWGENDIKIGFKELEELGYLIPDEAYSIYRDNYLYYRFHESIEIDE